MLGANLSLHVGLFVSVTVMLLCFIMGLQNAIITKISQAEIRTTHVTGLVTDLGIELGMSFYWNMEHEHQSMPMAVGNRQRLKVLMSLLMMFFGGGVVGAMGFKRVGFASTIPLAFLLLALAAVPVLDDVKPGLHRVDVAGIRGAGYAHLTRQAVALPSACRLDFWCCSRRHSFPGSPA